MKTMGHKVSYAENRGDRNSVSQSCAPLILSDLSSEVDTLRHRCETFSSCQRESPESHQPQHRLPAPQTPYRYSSQRQ